MLRGCRTMLIAAVVLLGTMTRADAEATTFEASEAPLIRVGIREGNIRIRTWDRQGVQIEADPGVSTQRRVVTVPAQRDIPIFEGRIPGKNGPIVLPAETFVVSTLPKGPRDVISLSGSGNLTMTIPLGTPLLVVQLGRGSVSLSDLRQGTFIVRVRNGSATLKNVGNDGFVQVMAGTIGISESVFNRVRIRSALAHIFFENCHAKQIDVTSIEGSVVFDNGSLEPGLARFGSATGSIALGVNGPATISAHAADGQIYTLFDKRSTAEIKGGDGTANVEGGGPLVTASSGTGNIYLFSGSIRNRRDIPPSWTPFFSDMRRALQRSDLNAS